jgi:hypothetical protein
VNAVEITEATQVVAPPRWSETVTTPSEPVIVLELLEASWVPSDTLPVGALIDSPPAVSSKEAGVAAPAGRLVAAVRVAAMLASSRNLRIRDPSIERPAEMTPDSPSALYKRTGLPKPRAGIPGTG